MFYQNAIVLLVRGLQDSDRADIDAMGRAEVEDPPRSLTWNDMEKSTFLLHNTLYVLAVDLILYPSDLLTTRLQADRVSHGDVSIHRVFRDIVRREGPKGTGG